MTLKSFPDSHEKRSTVIWSSMSYAPPPTESIFDDASSKAVIITKRIEKWG
jgi:hypothetical protein